MWDAQALPPRTHEGILNALAEMRDAETLAFREKLGRHYGLRCRRGDTDIGPVIGRRVQSSLDYARSFPWDWMHLFCENNVPNLVSLWMGRFKTLGDDEGSGCYIISDNVWAEIAAETTAAMQDIPSAFVSLVPDLINGRESFTAEIWAFWFMYLAPTLLYGRFADDKYYDHMMDLIAIMKKTLQFEITRIELEDLRQDIIRWVERYEELYYQYDADRLSVCLLVVHGLLHVVDDILAAGPVWATWTFFMERFCGHLKQALHSRASPWAHLDRLAVNLAHASQLRAKYSDPELQAHLSPTSTRLIHCPEATHQERVFDGYPLSYLRGPCLKNYQPGQDIRKRVARYLGGLLGGGTRQVAANLPSIIPAWGKVRIGHGGDSIRAMIAQRSRLGTHERCSSFVRYETMAFDATGQNVREIHYGELQAILEVYLDSSQRIWGDYRGSTLLLALLRPCKTNGGDAARTHVTYHESAAEVVVDLQAIHAVVGRVKSRGKWGIIDRSNGMARTVFVAEDVSRGDQDPDEVDDRDAY
ncbi:hypothetical protein FKP32DRAFT_114346 [Trametes sanguinea]|nr:hypothetical protein FKP32DRAFT_114346 [Trametes sanguinea]